jgi:hypothetical protein
MRIAFGRLIGTLPICRSSTKTDRKPLTLPRRPLRALTNAVANLLPRVPWLLNTNRHRLTSAAVVASPLDGKPPRRRAGRSTTRAGTSSSSCPPAASYHVALRSGSSSAAVACARVATIVRRRAAGEPCGGSRRARATGGRSRAHRRAVADGRLHRARRARRDDGHADRGARSGRARDLRLGLQRVHAGQRPSASRRRDGSPTGADPATRSPLA